MNDWRKCGRHAHTLQHYSAIKKNEMKCCHATWMDLDSIMPREISFSKRGFNSIIRTGHGTTHWFQIGKGVCQGCILSPCFFNLYAEFSSGTQSCPTLWDPMDCSMPGLPAHHQLPEFTQTHVHWVDDTINHLIFCCPLLLLPSIFPSIRVFLMSWLFPWHTTFTILNQSNVPCSILTISSCPECMFLRRQFRWSGISMSWRISHSLLWSTQSKALA